MGDFEDEIRKKLQEGEMNYNPSDWEKMNQNLSSNPPHTPFENEINDKLNDGSVETPSNAWDEFNDKYNSKSNFEQKLKEKLNSDTFKYNAQHWENLVEQLELSKLTPLERILRSVFNNGKLNYNPSHWAALEKTLRRRSIMKKMLRGAAAILILIGTGLGIDSLLKDSENPVITSKTHNKNTSSEINQIINPITIPSNIDVISLDNNLPPKNHEENVQNSFTPQNTRTTKEFIPVGIQKQNDVDLINTSNNSQEYPYDPLIQLENFPIQEYCTSLDLSIHKISLNHLSKGSYQIHPGATIWLNFWENSSITGLYANNNASFFYHNNWEINDVDQNQIGEINFVQPLTYIAAFERRLNPYFAIGGFYQYELKENWNNRKGNVSISFTKNILNQLDLKTGLAVNFNSDQLAVNQLTLREQSLIGEYIHQTNLGSFKSQQEQYTTMDFGVFLNHRSFYIGYNRNNMLAYSFTNEHELTNQKHTIVSAIHTPEIAKFQTSLLLKYEHELFNSYSPGIGLTYNNQFFSALEYESLLNKNITVGYQHGNRIRFQFTYNRKNTKNLQRNTININNFTEKKGYLSGGVNYKF